MGLKTTYNKLKRQLARREAKAAKKAAVAKMKKDIEDMRKKLRGY